MGKTSSLFLFSLVLISFSYLVFAEACSIDQLYRCVGTSAIEQCLGGAWTSQGSCPSGTPICVEQGGGSTFSCLAQICTLGDSQCSDSAHLTFCTNKGTSWTSPPTECPPCKNLRFNPDISSPRGMPVAIA